MTSISIKQNSAGASVVLDGVEISHGLQGLEVSMEPQSFLRNTLRTRVTLDVLIAEDFQLCVKDPIIIIPKATADTLKALGWTAPEATA